MWKDLADSIVDDYFSTELSPEDYYEDMRNAVENWDKFQKELKSRFEKVISDYEDDIRDSDV